MTTTALSPPAAEIFAEVLQSFPYRSWTSDELALLAAYSTRMAALQAQGFTGASDAEWDDALALSDMLRISPRARLLLAEARQQFPGLSSIPHTPSVRTAATTH